MVSVCSESLSLFFSVIKGNKNGEQKSIFDVKLLGVWKICFDDEIFNFLLKIPKGMLWQPKTWDTKDKIYRTDIEVHRNLDDLHPLGGFPTREIYQVKSWLSGWCLELVP